jgi:hypothetical protein
VRVQPRLHEDAQPLAPEREPALALGRVLHEHVLEAAERALAVDGLGQLPLQLRVLDHRDVPLHPAVLLAGAHRIDAEVVRIRGDPRVHLRIGHTVDDAQHVARAEVEVRVDLGGVVLEGVFQRLPVDRDVAHDGPAG